MALVKISQSQLCRLGKVKPSETEPILTALGIALEAQEGDTLSCEITPNRPDWLSVEGIARSACSYKSGKPKIYSSQKSSISWTIDPSVLSVRPFLGSAYVSGVQMTPELLESLIQLQEKLHDTLGRGRRKMAIGLHDSSAIRPPYTYKAVSREEARFVPLGRFAPMTCGQILTEHEKGIAFSHLVGEQCPLIADAAGEVLSFPPIINGERTRVGETSQNLLIDCTGTSAFAVQVTVSILAAALADHGGQVFSVQISNKPYPVFTPRALPLPLKEARSVLDSSLTQEKISAHLRRLGHEVSGRMVHPPAFRADILHAVDLVEDIAISIGYNAIEARLPAFSSTASFLDDSALHEALLGMGYFEALSWILTSRTVLAKAALDLARARSVSNPLTEEFSTLRPALYPNLLDIFSRSKSEPYPQYLYEVGPVEIPAASESQSAAPSKFEQGERIVAAATHSRAGFSESVSHLNGLLDALAVPHALEPCARPGFISGRCARVLANGQPAGFVGEIHPSVLEAFGLEQPVALFELDAQALGKK